jgi:hypothetical protein
MSDSSLVAVEMLTDGLRISGYTDQPDQRKRLSDLLNEPADEVLLKDVVVRTLSGIALETCRTMVVQKREVIVAIPRESPGQIAQRRLNRLGYANPDTRPRAVIVVLPPFMARGMMHFRVPRDFQRGTSRLPRFFPLLDSELRRDAQLIESGEVMLVGRDKVMALGQTDPSQPRVAPRESAGEARASESPQSRVFRPGNLT